MVGAGRRARLRPQPAARGRAARPGRSASTGDHPTHSHALGATSPTPLRPASKVPGHVQSGSRREVGRSGRWRPRLGSSLGRCARGFLFHRPGPALTPGPRLPAWPRVWSPAPRGSLRPAWTRIRGASVAICQEGRKVQGNQLQIAVLDLRRAPPELEGKQEDAPPGLGPGENLLPVWSLGGAVPARPPARVAGSARTGSPGHAGRKAAAPREEGPGCFAQGSQRIQSKSTWTCRSPRARISCEADREEVPAQRLGRGVSPGTRPAEKAGALARSGDVLGVAGTEGGGAGPETCARAARGRCGPCLPAGVPPAVGATHLLPRRLNSGN
ncbi:uncharacterized protein LOC116552199 [Sapajus apella]|uniref:Uncharacterized protein LOC116552199 n=1 Tax=Sapajus apella TaxID=9515 RepID=A0A6J3HXT3_SAPAP|nr:uncharacterized protein LOC116552199 [Sapajus apella]